MIPMFSKVQLSHSRSKKGRHNFLNTKFVMSSAPRPQRYQKLWVFKEVAKAGRESLKVYIPFMYGIVIRRLLVVIYGKHYYF